MINIIAFTKKHSRILLVLAVLIIFADATFLTIKYQASMQPNFSDTVLNNNKLYQAHVNNAIKRVQDEAPKSIPAGSFDQGVTEEIKTTFENFYQTIRTPEIFRMKVWNRDSLIIWSNATELIGKSFPDDEAAHEALEGKIETEIKQSKAEQFTESSYSNFVEIYIPIKDTSGQVVGIVETYSVIEDVIKQLRQEFWYALLFTVVISLGVFALGYLGVKRFVR